MTNEEIDHKVKEIAKAYVNAKGLGMEMLSTVSAGAEVVMNHVPDFARKHIDKITQSALEKALTAANATRKVSRDRGPIMNKAMTTVTGMIGGVAGLPGAVIELPITVTLLMRSILGIAEEYGFDPEDEAVKAEAVRVFAEAGPSSDDDLIDMSLVAARLSITGQSVQSVISRAAPKISAILSKKLIAQAAPLIGAATGGTINLMFTNYYQEVSRAHFSLMRLSEDTGTPKRELIAKMKKEVERLNASSKKESVEKDEDSPSFS